MSLRFLLLYLGYMLLFAFFAAVGVWNLVPYLDFLPRWAGGPLGILIGCVCIIVAAICAYFTEKWWEDRR